MLLRLILVLLDKEERCEQGECVQLVLSQMPAHEKLHTHLLFVQGRLCKEKGKEHMPGIIHVCFNSCVYQVYLSSCLLDCTATAPALYGMRLW
jgi:hypothetical protein